MSDSDSDKTGNVPDGELWRLGQERDRLKEENERLRKSRPRITAKDYQDLLRKAQGFRNQLAQVTRERDEARNLCNAVPSSLSPHQQTFVIHALLLSVTMDPDVESRKATFDVAHGIAVSLGMQERFLAMANTALAAVKALEVNHD